MGYRRRTHRRVGGHTSDKLGRKLVSGHTSPSGRVHFMRSYRIGQHIQDDITVRSVHGRTHGKTSPIVRDHQHLHWHSTGPVGPVGDVVAFSFPCAPHRRTGPSPAG